MGAVTHTHGSVMGTRSRNGAGTGLISHTGWVRVKVQNSSYHRLCPMPFASGGLWSN